MIEPVYTHPWLTLDLGRVMRVISWAPHRGGIVDTRHILWRELRNADLPPDLDVFAWLKKECAARHMEDAVAMLTSRKIATFTTAFSKVDEVTAKAVATVGLSNAVRAAPLSDRCEMTAKSYGTINVAVILSYALDDIALIEAQNVASAARTAAVLESGVKIASGLATGTGTDCTAIAAPVGTDPYCGLHTPQGQAIAAAVYQAVHEGAAQWIKETGGKPYDLG